MNINCVFISLIARPESNPRFDQIIVFFRTGKHDLSDLENSLELALKFLFKLTLTRALKIFHLQFCLPWNFYLTF